MRYLALPIGIFTLAVAGFYSLPSKADPVPEKIDFNTQIRPLLSKYCFQCHGPDEKQRKGGFRLDLKSGAFADLGGYHAIEAGDAKKSRLFERITSTEKSKKMPPAKTGKTMTKDEIALIQAWIDQGANWEEHWAFTTPVRPALPKVKNAVWPKNPIDHFILARLEKEGLSPSAEADRTTLIRRVTLDLTGLPPTPAEVEAFLMDKSPNAYEKVVDRLLNSEHYGEHQARFWLDAARYGDTHGLHLDNYREIWPYRDWVINAFNNNLSYDQFIIQQLAGDLLPNPTKDNLVATGFNRCNVSTSEGGSIPEEVDMRNVVDRVETMSTVFMGLTMGCAVCHDHKFDPISQKDFYQMYAYFNSLDGNPLDGNAAQHAPVIKIPTAEQKKQLAGFQEQQARLQKEIQDKIAAFKYVEPATPKTPTLPEPKEVVWFDDDLPTGAKPQTNNNDGWKWITAPQPVFSGKKASTRKAEALDQHFFTGATQTLKIGKGDKLFTYVYLDPQNPPKAIMLQFNDGQWEHRAYWGSKEIPYGADNTPAKKPMGKLPAKGKWIRLEVDAEQVGLKPGAVLNGWAFTQFGGTVHWDKAGIVQMPDPSLLQFDSLVQWEDYQRKLKTSSLPKEIQALVKLDTAKRNPAQQKQLTEYFIGNVYYGTRSTFEPLQQKLTQISKQATDLEKSFPSTLVWKEMASPKPAFLMKRGQYDQKGEKVERATPAALPPMPKDFPNNRLGVAKWLVSPEHPLTTRVAVNRFWQQYFGTGLVKTSEDFGNQGDRPTHPQLLDWLAVEFRESGWDIKKMQKLIVTSATYRQSSKVTPELYAKDPQNKWLARGPRVRLDGEVLRDQALALSGLLVPKIGGPGVKPPQPDLWSAVAYVGSNTMNFKKDSGADKVYRRSLYTFWKRTAPPPQMNLMDAPSREHCSVRRERTNTPLQALMLMNDPQYVEAARVLGQRILKDGGKTVEQRATFLFQLATLRTPGAFEMDVLKNAFAKFHAEYKANPKAAQQLIQVGESPPDSSLDPVELASWTMMANLVLNMDEVINKN